MDLLGCIVFTKRMRVNMYIRMQIRMFLDVISDMHLVWFQPSICWVVPGSHRSQWQLGKYRGMGCCGGEVEGRLKMWKKTVEWVGKRNQRCSFFESNKVVWHAVYGYWILHLNIRLMLCCHWFVIATESLVMLERAGGVWCMHFWWWFWPMANCGDFVSKLP